VQKLLELLPGAIAAFGLGYAMRKSQASKQEAKILDLELENERLRNAKKIDEKYSGKSDSDVIDSKLSE
jgi:hypothetical protein